MVRHPPPADRRHQQRLLHDAALLALHLVAAAPRSAGAGAGCGWRGDGEESGEEVVEGAEGYGGEV